MDPKQREMLSTKNAVERIVTALVIAHEKSHSPSEEILREQINDVMHAFVASRQLKRFQWSKSPPINSLEVLIEDHDNNGCTLTFLFNIPRKTFTPAEMKAKSTNSANAIDDELTQIPVHASADAPEGMKNASLGVSWPFPVGQASAQAPVNRTKSSPKINFIRNREDLQKAGKEENPEDTYDRVKKAFS